MSAEGTSTPSRRAARASFAPGGLPIRLRVTLAFSAVMALLLGAAGVGVYVWTAAEFDHLLDDGLRAHTADLAAIASETQRRPTQSRTGRLGDTDEGLAQIVTVDGHVLLGSAGLPRRSLLTDAELRRAASRALRVERREVPGVEGGSARLLATPVASNGRGLVVVVAGSLDDGDDALRHLARLLLLGCPLALALASGAGYGVAAAALRPVESMRREAAAVSVVEPGRRLPVPSTSDEIARLGNTLNEMLTRQETAFARERGFVADASHELRTPLAILKTELELALRHGRSLSEFEATIRSAAEETDRLSQLAEDLLVIAHSDQGRLPVRLARTRVAEILAGGRERFARRFADEGRRIVVEDTGDLEVLADPLRLEQALGNLIDNALRHGAGTVRLSASQTTEEVVLRVDDEGGGFPPGFTNRAFERFTRADEARARGGAGLGLAIVDAIIRAHRGRVEARVGTQGGAEVSMRLPALNGREGSPAATGPRNHA